MMVTTQEHSSVVLTKASLLLMLSLSLLLRCCCCDHGGDDLNTTTTSTTATATATTTSSSTSSRTYSPTSLLTSSMSMSMSMPMSSSSSSSSSSSTRELATVVYDDFVSLPINNEDMMKPCTSFTHKFGMKEIYINRIFITPGECYIMDNTYRTVTFQNGIEIRGKLIFPDNNYNNDNNSNNDNNNDNDSTTLTIISPMIAIQGELEMTSTKPVNGIPSIKFIMIGTKIEEEEEEEDQYFRPIGIQNQNACDIQCPAGKKSIVVAGGKVNITGLPPNIPTWTHLYDVSGNRLLRPTGIIVDAIVKDHWISGASILITSHTQSQNDQQVRIIQEVSKSVIVVTNDDGTISEYVELILDRPIIRPTTLLDSKQFAVEVALLSRNIVFEGGYDHHDDDTSNDLHGGHFWILRTPHNKQYIDGIQFINFGQQGKLGRYPIHFHLCKDVTGSIISRNTVMNSNQRCIVIHGSDNILIKENIAYNTVGHCYILEDGVETGNRFIQNLGAYTRAPIHLIRIKNDIESDKIFTSTYWITNMDNTMIGNVAAGSRNSGIWFDLFARGPLLQNKIGNTGIIPKEMPFAIHRDNVVHSNLVGLRTYPDGVRPLHGEGNIIGLRSYNNYELGAFIHVSKNINISNSLFANNRLSVMLNRADGIEFHNTTFIAMSNSYKQNVIDTRPLRIPAKQYICPKKHTAGIELHNRKTDYILNGTTIQNVTFIGYSDLQTTKICKHSYPVRFSRLHNTGIFDFYATVQDISTIDIKTDAQGKKKTPFYFCSAVSVGIVDAYVIDVDQSLRPPGLPEPMDSTSSSTLVSDPYFKSSNMDDNFMLQFVDKTRCTKVNTGCYIYCQDTCFRSIRLWIDPSGTMDYKLKICHRYNEQQCIIVNHEWLQQQNREGYTDRKFVIHLPGDNQYTGVILDSSSNEVPVWPTFVYWEYDDQLCSDSIDGDSFEVLQPLLSSSSGDGNDVCMELVRNGNAEEQMKSTSIDIVDTLSDWEKVYFNYPPSWIAGLGDLYYSAGNGVDGSNAFTGSIDRSFLMIQYLDSRCLQQQQMQGKKYKFIAKIKEIKHSTNTPYICRKKSKSKMLSSCAQIGIRGVSMISSSSSSGSGSRRSSSTLFDIRFVTQRFILDNDGYQTIQGTFIINDQFIKASKVYIYVKESKLKDTIIYVDNISIIHIQ